MNHVFNSDVQQKITYCELARLTSLNISSETSTRKTILAPSGSIGFCITEIFIGTNESICDLEQISSILLCCALRKNISRVFVVKGDNCKRQQRQICTLIGCMLTYHFSHKLSCITVYNNSHSSQVIRMPKYDLPSTFALT